MTKPTIECQNNVLDHEKCMKDNLWSNLLNHLKNCRSCVANIKKNQNFDTLYPKKKAINDICL